MLETDSERIDAYLFRSDKYWSQVQEFLQAGELEKASELAWGSVAERVKALGLARTAKLLRSHSQLTDYAKTVANQMQDGELREGFAKAERLHANFYESFLDSDEIKRTLAHIPALLAKIDFYLRKGNET